MDEQDLARRDAEGYIVLEVISYSRPPPAGSHASPHAFVCIDGRTYWLKRQAQQGLFAELVAGRLGAIVGAAPDARVVRLSDEAGPVDGSAHHLLGLGVGLQDQPGMENLRHLSSVLTNGALDPTKLDVAARVRVLAFPTWLGVGDTQILVDLRNGRLQSIDHGEWGSDPASRDVPTIISTPGVPDDFGREKDHVDDAMERIRSVTDERILDAVSRMPTGPEWGSARERRLAVAQWLAFRRDRLVEVMRRWLTGR